MLELDHLAVGCESLEAGRDWVEAALGCALQPGGQHAHFGTHNLLLGLEHGHYLEVIAVDPVAPPLGYARWFDLDRFTGPPRLSNWICRTPDLPAALKALPEAGIAVALSRGDLRWQMAVPRDGALSHDNCAPAVMMWEGAAHPAARLAASGITLRRLTVRHPEAAVLAARLAPHFADDRIAFETGQAALHAAFETPWGARAL